MKYTIDNFLKENWWNTDDTYSLKLIDAQKDVLYNYKEFKKQLQFAGFDKEEVSVSYENDYLTVEGNSSMLDSQYTKKYYLPSKYYDIDNINVKFEKCILTIECKLKGEKESKVMKIIIK
jgi:HSP20 family molecular chaperone IbpA